MRIIFLVISLIFFSCNDTGIFDKDKKSKKVAYSFSCLDSALSGKPFNKELDKAGDLIRDLAFSGNDISDQEEMEYGDVFHQQMIDEGAFKLVDDQRIHRKLEKVLHQLLESRTDPSDIKYQIYTLDDTTINAFTFGGRIYITKAMFRKCEENDALLYAIVGHEIGHSEVGHIKTTIQELELSNQIFGEQNGSTFFQIKKLLTASFNQKNELEADYYGINLTNEVGYDVCTAVAFWKEMASKENHYSQLEDFFRTHPFSKLRADCLVRHIEENFGKNCGTINGNKAMPEVPER